MNEEVLVHHGVKGQRWGVITKEYVPKGTHSAKADQNKRVQRFSSVFKRDWLSVEMLSSQNVKRSCRRS